MSVCRRSRSRSPRTRMSVAPAFTASAASFTSARSATATTGTVASIARIARMMSAAAVRPSPSGYGTTHTSTDGSSASRRSAAAPSRTTSRCRRAPDSVTPASAARKSASASSGVSITRRCLQHRRSYASRILPDHVRIFLTLMFFFTPIRSAHMP